MTAPLHLVRTEIDRAMLAAYAAATGTLDDDLGYALHLSLRRRFGTAAPQPFRRMEPPAGARPGTPDTLFGYVADPAPLLAASADAEPAVPDPFGDWSSDGTGPQDGNPLLPRIFSAPFEAKAMPCDWRAGQRLAFEVLVRPVRRHGPKVRAARAADGREATGEEHDAFLSAVERLPPGTHRCTRERIYAEWLAERMAPAATLDGAEPILKSFRRTRLWRSLPGRGGRGRMGRGVEHPEALMAGTLVIKDPAAFATLLARGIGRHTAFGFGMLLLRPPSSERGH